MEASRIIAARGRSLRIDALGLGSAKTPAATRGTTPALNPPAPTTGPPHVGETGVRDGPQRGVSRDDSPFVPSTLATRKTVFSNREMSNDEGRDLGQSRCAEENEKFGSSIDIACPSTFLSTAPASATAPDAPRRKVSLQGVRDHDDSLARLKYLTFAVCSCFFSCSRRISSPPFLPKQQPNAAAAPLSQVDLSRQAQLPSSLVALLAASRHREKSSSFQATMILH